MSDERVDKEWQKKGLAKYPMAAILGTLRYYGVQVDEAQIERMAHEMFPLQMLDQWLPYWKGALKFAEFPAVAADELWKRFNPDRLWTYEYAEVLARLLGQLGRVLNRVPGVTPDEALQKLDALKPKVPLKEGKVDPGFATDVVARLGDKWLAFFGKVVWLLVESGRVEYAQACAELQVFLFPAMSGIPEALLRLARGEKEAAVAELLAIGRDASRDEEGRIAAMETLIDVSAHAQATELARELFDGAEAAGNLSLALEVGPQLLLLLEKANQHAERRVMEERVRKLQQAQGQAR